jgi:hypothetical protein
MNTKQTAVGLQVTTIGSALVFGALVLGLEAAETKSGQVAAPAAESAVKPGAKVSEPAAGAVRQAPGVEKASPATVGDGAAPAAEPKSSDPGVGGGSPPFPATQADVSTANLASSADACKPCESYACADDRFWVRAEYLIWWTKGSHVPVLAATGTPNEPFTTPLFGGSTLNGDGRSGFHITLGGWLDRCHTLGLEGDYFDLERGNDGYDSGFYPSGTVLSRPFIDMTDPNNPAPAAEITALPGLAVGKVHVETSDYFQSAGLRLRQPLYQSCCQVDCCTTRSTEIDLVAGYRFYRLKDRLNIHENVVAIGGPNIGLAFDIVDDFNTSNEFHGGELGLVADVRRGRWSLGVRALAALGNSHEIVNILGRTVRTSNGVEETDAGGLFALRSNIGHYTRNHFAVLPELGMEIGYQWTCHLRTYVGYDILYWGDVVRASEQIDPRIDTNNLPFPPPDAPAGGPFPAVLFRETSYWAQGIRVGAELRF